MSCSVYGCPNRHGSNNSEVFFHNFPRDPMIAEEWIHLCGFNNAAIHPNTAKICSIHFEESSYTTDLKMMDYMAVYSKILKSDALPSLYLPVMSSEGNKDAEDRKNLTPNQLEELKSCNEKLQESVHKQEIDLNQLRRKLGNLVKEHKEKDMELTTLKNDAFKMKHEMLPIAKQKALLAKVFSDAQIKILCGKRKIYWSNDDMAVAYTIRHLSSKRMYLHLTKRLNIPLPAMSSIKRWTSSKNSKNHVKKETQHEEESSNSNDV